MLNPSDGGLVQDLRRYLAVFQRRKALLFSCLVVSLAIATVYNYTARPMYQATAQVQIARTMPKVLPQQTMDVAAPDLQYELQILRSRPLLEKVVDRLDLQKRPELLTASTMSPWERFQRKFVGQPPPAETDPNGMPLSPAIAAMRSRIGLEPVTGGVVRLTFRAYEPDLAASVANALAELYIDHSVELRLGPVNTAEQFLTEQIKEQKKKLEEAEGRLQDFRRKHGIPDESAASDRSNQTAALETALVSARMERLAKEGLLNQLRAMTPTQLAGSSTVMGSPGVADARHRLSSAQAELQRLSDTLGDRHPDMVRAREAVRDADDRLRAETQAFVHSLESEYRVAAGQEASMAASLETARRGAGGPSQGLAEYSVLKREVETNQQLLDGVIRRARETGLEGELKSSNAKLWERAEVPTAPFIPNRPRNYQLALLLGLALGVGLTLLFEHLDNSLKTPDDVKEHLGLPFLGMVPDVELTTKNSPGADRPSPLIVKSPQSAVAEAYRVIRTNLVFSSAEQQGRAILATSAGPGEGKTTTVANLASSLAMNGAKVLAVDADLRRPTMHHHFGVAKAPGLSDLIVGKSAASKAIQTTRFPGLQVLPCGYPPPNPAELLSSAAMRQIVEALRSHYDWVLIDTPPVLGMADTAVIAPLVDGVVLVVAAEVSARTAIQRAVEQLQKVGGRILGVVLNKVNLERNSYYYSHYYGEYYRSYYAEKDDKGGKRREERGGTRAARRN